MLFGRPIGVWLVLLYLAFVVLGTGSNIASALAAGKSYGAFHNVFSAGIVGLAAWLFVEVVRNGSKQVLAVRLNLVLYTVYYGLIAFATYKSQGQDAAIAAIILGAVMCAIWLIIHWYLGRRTTAKA